MTLCQEAFESTQIMVFVIDDDPSVRKSLSRLLSSVGLRSKTFASPEEFLTTERYDGLGCIVLDVRMPGISGPDLQDRLVRENCTLPIVFITGHGSLPMAVTALKKGAVDFLTKPFDDERFLDSIGRAISAHRELKRTEAGRTVTLR